MEVAQQPQRKGEKNEVVLLALDYTTDWYKLFRGCKTAGGLPIRVEQSEWKDLHVEARCLAPPPSQQPRLCQLLSGFIWGGGEQCYGGGQGAH